MVLDAMQSLFFRGTNEAQGRTVASRVAAGSAAPHLIHKAPSPTVTKKLSPTRKLKLWTR